MLNMSRPQAKQLCMVWVYVTGIILHVQCHRELYTCRSPHWHCTCTQYYQEYIIKERVSNAPYVCNNSSESNVISPPLMSKFAINIHGHPSNLLPWHVTMPSTESSKFLLTMKKGHFFVPRPLCLYACFHDALPTFSLAGCSSIL